MLTNAQIVNVFDVVSGERTRHKKSYQIAHLMDVASPLTSSNIKSNFSKHHLYRKHEQNKQLHSEMAMMLTTEINAYEIRSVGILHMDQT